MTCLRASAPVLAWLKPPVSSLLCDRRTGKGLRGESFLTGDLVIEGGSKSEGALPHLLSSHSLLGCPFCSDPEVRVHKEGMRADHPQHQKYHPGYRHLQPAPLPFLLKFLIILRASLQNLLFSLFLHISLRVCPFFLSTFPPWCKFLSSSLKSSISACFFSISRCPPP